MTERTTVWVPLIALLPLGERNRVAVELMVVVLAKNTSFFDPTIPEMPETPDTPLTPLTPDSPETPETPENPETPETPDTPLTPLAPADVAYSAQFVVSVTGSTVELLRLGTMRIYEAPAYETTSAST
jgi:hypothetical protein